MLEGVLDLGRGGTFQSRTERDIVVRTSLARLEQLDIGDQALYFGRIDQLPRTGRPRHAGRVLPHRPPGRLGPGPRAPGRRLAGTGGRTLLPGHRARPPGAGPPAPPGRAWPQRARARGRVLRRPRGPPVDGGADAADGAGPRAGGERLLSDGMVLGGPGALLSALGQARTGHMGDIIGTIQREQDEIIRSPLAGVLIVQGGPGTGKTAVALHRAAYLLYTHRFPLERQGVLVVGPNPLFLRYIEQVLPSLGETGVSLSTVSGLVPEVRVRGVDDPAVAKLKGDVRMVKVLARAVRDAAAPAAPRRRGAVRRGRPAPATPRRPRRSSPWPGAGRARTTHGGASSNLRWYAPWPTSTGPGSRAAASTSARTGRPGGAERSGPADPPGPRGVRSARTHVAPALAPRVPARSPRGPTTPRGRRQRDPHARGDGSASTGPRSASLDDRPVDGRRYRTDRRGAHPARPAPRRCPDQPVPGAASR